MTNRKQSQKVMRSCFPVDAGHARLTVVGRASYGCGVSKTSQKLTYILVGLMITLVVAGCSKDNPWENPGPKESFETFMMDLWRGNRAEVFEAVWPEDKKWLMAAGAELEKDYPRIPALKPEEWLVVGRVDNPFDIRRLEIPSDTASTFTRGDRVMLEIHYFDERVGQAEMVWGGERWYVALPESVADEQSVLDGVNSGNDGNEEVLQLPDNVADEVSNGDE